mgnify:CR=1 FL=1
MNLSILICSLVDRSWTRIELIKILQSQGYHKEVEILCEIDRGEMSIGHKRNLLLDRAKGEYVCFIDDDDTVSSDYLSKIMGAIETKPDCCSLVGVITWNGDNPEIFEHSIKYSEYKTRKSGAITYERYPNHLNVIKTDIAKQFRFPEISHGEDTDWATQIFKSGLLKSEATIPGVIYHYNYKQK